MKYKNFDDFFSSIDINKNEMIDNWENLKKRKKKITIITTIVMITIILSLFYLICYNTKLIRLIIPMFILFVIIITKLINTESKISKEIIKSNQEYKEKIIEKMLQNFIDELDYIPLKEMPSDIFDEANYGGYYNSYVSDDYFEGKINNQNIKMADLLVQRITVEKDKDGNEEKKVMTIFGGLFGKIELEKSINSNLNITRDYSSSIKKTQKLEMDSYGFEKIFNVYTDNNIIAMQLLTSDIQEGLLDIYNKYKSKIEYFIYNIVKDYQKAEDLTQETFIYVMQNKLQEDSSFKYYIYLVAKSKAFNYINVEKRRYEINKQYVLSSNEEVSNDILEEVTLNVAA